MGRIKANFGNRFEAATFYTWQAWFCSGRMPVKSFAPDDWYDFGEAIALASDAEPGLLEWIGDASGAVSVELILDGQQDSRAEGHSPLDHRVRIGDVKVNE